MALPSMAEIRELLYGLQVIDLKPVSDSESLLYLMSDYIDCRSPILLHCTDRHSTRPQSPQISIVFYRSTSGIRSQYGKQHHHQAIPSSPHSRDMPYLAPTKIWLLDTSISSLENEVTSWSTNWSDRGSKSKWRQMMGRERDEWGIN